MFSLFSWGQLPPAFRDDLRLDGPRVYLRPRVMADDNAMYDYLKVPEVIRYLPWETAPSAEAIRPMLHESIEQRKRCEALGLAIVLCETGKMIGQADLMDLKTQRGQAELGYVSARDCWGLGLMTEATHLIAAHGFGPLRLERMIAYADTENMGSRRVLEKLGMRLTGMETRQVKGEQRPYVRYEVTRAEWEASRLHELSPKQVRQIGQPR